MQPDGDLISSIDMVDSESRRKKDKSTVTGICIQRNKTESL